MYRLIIEHLPDTRISLFIVFIITTVSIISAVRLFIKRRIKESPMDTLQRMYSKGEIESQEFEQRKRQLQKDQDLKLRSYFLSRI